MSDRIDLLKRIEKLEKENESLTEELKCAEINFETCNADLAALGELVGGSCYDYTYDLVKHLVDKTKSKKIVIKDSEDRYIKFNIYCPTCGEMIDRGNHPCENLLDIKHCDQCGQKLDWGEE